jgi:hypothetical protein
MSRMSDTTNLRAELIPLDQTAFRMLYTIGGLLLLQDLNDLFVLTAMEYQAFTVSPYSREYWPVQLHSERISRKLRTEVIWPKGDLADCELRTYPVNSSAGAPKCVDMRGLGSRLDHYLNPNLIESGSLMR